MLGGVLKSDAKSGTGNNVLLGNLCLLANTVAMVGGDSAVYSVCSHAILHAQGVAVRNERHDEWTDVKACSVHPL